jgi:hypothetical protein
MMRRESGLVLSVLITSVDLVDVPAIQSQLRHCIHPVPIRFQIVSTAFP